MAERGIQRRLAAIVSTDIVGYSRLMGADETGTLARMKALRQQLWTPIIEKHGGRVVGTAGDSLLVEYSSAVSAVESAIEMQKGMAEGEAERPDDEKMQLRIGVNIGEVMVEAGDIYGDGVNVAARLQSIAPPGGVCIAGKVYDETVGKLSATFIDCGECELKNIARQVRVWSWRVGGAALPSTKSVGVRSQLLEYPSIAVMPFAFLGSNNEIGWIAEGLTLDIAHHFTRNTPLRVVERTATAGYSEKVIDPIAAGNSLNVDFVLTGVVRASGARLRVNTELSSIRDAQQLWIESYDGDLATQDIFEFQDRITRNVIAAIGSAQGIIVKETRKLVADRPAIELSTYECIITAYGLLESFKEDDHYRARNCLEQSAKREPSFSEAWALLAAVYLIEHSNGLNPRPDPLERALNAAETAIRIDGNNQFAWARLAAIRFYQFEWDLFVTAAQQALHINPDEPTTLGFIGHLYSVAGEHEIGVPLVDKALSLVPFPPFWWHNVHTYVAQDKGDWASVLANSNLYEPQGFWWGCARRAAAYAHLNETAKAKAEIEKMLELKPDLAKTFRHELRKFNSPESRAEAWIDGFRKAGFNVADEEI